MSVGFDRAGSLMDGPEYHHGAFHQRAQNQPYDPAKVMMATFA